MTNHICQHDMDAGEEFDVAERGGEGRATEVHSGMHDVFISHASQDAAVANALVSALEYQALSCWVAPRDVTPGTHYAGAIVHAIDAAKAIVLILSQNAAASPHVLREVERATSKRHPIVTLRIDRAPLPAEFEYFLNTSQWLDATGSDTLSAIPKLVAAVRLAIEKPATLVTPIAATPVAREPAYETYPPPEGDRSQSRTAIVAGSLVILASAGFAAYRFLQPVSGAPARTVVSASSAAIPAAMALPEKSIAVLPFADMSENRDSAVDRYGDGRPHLVRPLRPAIGRRSQDRGRDCRGAGARITNHRG
jgi:hypothetical protein